MFNILSKCYIKMTFSCMSTKCLHYATSICVERLSNRLIVLIISYVLPILLKHIVRFQYLCTNMLSFHNRDVILLNVRHAISQTNGQWSNQQTSRSVNFILNRYNKLYTHLCCFLLNLKTTNTTSASQPRNYNTSIFS